MKTTLSPRLAAGLALALLGAGSLPLAGLEPAGAAGLPTVSASDVSVVEGTGPNLTTANVTVSLSAPSARPIDVDVRVDGANSTATSGVDYLANPARLHFEPGVTARTYPVLLVQDRLNEQDERIRVLATPASADAVPGDGEAALTVRDDDRPTVVKPGIPSARVTEGDRGTNPVLRFTVRLDEAPAQRATLVYQAVHTFGGVGPATPGVDFLEKTGVLAFEPGQTSATIDIQVIGDGRPERDERVIVNLSTPINLQFPGTVSGQPGMILHGDIVNDD